ncbi:rhodanese-like domain-containing protein [Nocardioides ferulae]|uniref:rhodanese-like domain-containing protein n=1 Tax=Nocardioides ferulae TaxID=2340821 RepID=UPI000EAC77B5|nr:rhodanese-like domain-containing protein [Nocardioides ferulae]
MHPTNQTLPREVDVASAASVLESDTATVLDVREPMEYVEAHVPGVQFIPMSQLAARLDELDRGRPVYVICASGNRSLAVADFLGAQGFSATSVAGGTTAWIRSGRPVESGRA